MKENLGNPGPTGFSKRARQSFRKAVTPHVGSGATSDAPPSVATQRTLTKERD